MRCWVGVPGPAGLGRAWAPEGVSSIAVTSEAARFRCEECDDLLVVFGPCRPGLSLCRIVVPRALSRKPAQAPPPADPAAQSSGSAATPRVAAQRVVGELERRSPCARARRARGRARAASAAASGKRRRSSASAASSSLLGVVLAERGRDQLAVDPRARAACARSARRPRRPAAGGPRRSAARSSRRPGSPARAARRRPCRSRPARRAWPPAGAPSRRPCARAG